MNHLLALEAKSIQSSRRLLSPIPTQGFLPVVEWLPILRAMPDQNLARAGIRWGFRIGFDRSNPLRSAKSNHPSVNDNAAIVDKHIDDEVAAGRLVAAPAIQVSPMGLIPKKGSFV